MKRILFILFFTLAGITILFAQNVAPVVANPIDDFSFEEDTVDLSINLNEVFYDANNDPLDFSYHGNQRIAIVITNGLVALTPEMNWNGSETITFIAEDLYGETVSDQVTITVSGVNDPPFVENPVNNHSVAYNSVDASLNLNYVFDDYDIVYGDFLTFDYYGDNFIDVEIISGVVTLTPAGNWAGTATITFTAEDSGGLSIEHEVEILVPSPAVANVSVIPNPFSPDGDGQKDETTINYYVSGNGLTTIYIFNESNVTVFETQVQAIAGWNEFDWDGSSNNGAYPGIVPDGSYGLGILIGSAEYICDFNIKVDTAPPVIDILASYPNPFSPNEDGYNDFHQVRFQVDDVIVSYIGLIRVNLWRELNDPMYPNDVATNFVEEGDGLTITQPDLSVFNELSDGGYVFVVRVNSGEPNHMVTLSPGAKYDLIIGGNGTSVHNRVEIETGTTMFKIGTINYPYLTVSGVGSDDHESDNEDNYTGYDYLRLFIVEGNCTFNIFNGGGSPYSLNSLYDIYYGDFQNVEHPLYPGTMISPNFMYNVTIPGNIDIDDDIMPDGRYIYRAIVTDQAMHAQEESGELLVNNYPIEVTSTVNPATISPQNLDGYFDQAVIQYQVSERGYVTVKVWDVMADTVVATLVDAVDTPTSNYTLWNGLNYMGDPVATNDQLEYQVEVTAQDVSISEDVVSMHIPLVVDNVGPEPADIFLLGGETYVNTPAITMGGISNDITSEVLLYLNDVYQGVVQTTPDYPGYFEFPVNLEEGENHIFVKLRDVAYNLGEASNSVTVHLDSSPPFIDPLFPPPDTLFRQDSIRVRAYVNDNNGIGVDQNTVKFGFSLYGNTVSWHVATRQNPTSSTYYYDYIVNDDIEQLDIDMWVKGADLLGNSATTTDSVHFEYRAIIPPDIMSFSPADGAVVNELIDNHVSAIVHDYEGAGLHFNGSQILVLNSSGTYVAGTRAFTSLGEDDYSFDFTPNSALGDGEYEVRWTVQDNFQGESGGSVTRDTTYFVFDSGLPTVSNATICNQDSETPVFDNMIINHSVEWVRIDMQDVTSTIDTTESYVHLHDGAGNQIDGTLHYEGDTAVWILTHPIEVNENNSGGYSLRYKAADIAGNALMGRIDFLLTASNAPQVSQRVPVPDSVINALVDNTISIVFTEAIGVDDDSDNTYIILHTPTGGVVQDGEGASLSLDSSQNPLYTLNLTLDSPLAQIGEYNVEYRLENTDGVAFGETYEFSYDNILPEVDNIGLSLEDNTYQYIDGGEEINQPILLIDASVSDNYGIIIDSCMVRIFNDQDELIAGASSQPSSNMVRYIMNSPLKAINKEFYIKATVMDLAGNTYVDSVRFLLNTVQADFYPADLSYQNGNVNHASVEVYELVEEDINANLSYLEVLHPDGNIIGDPSSPSEGSGATLSFSFTDSTTVINLQFQEPLSLTGVDDGNFQVNVYLALDEGEEIPMSYSFVYDSTKPVYSNLQVNSYPVAARGKDEKEEQPAPFSVSINRNKVDFQNKDNPLRGFLRSDYYSGRIDSIMVNFYDATSGLNPAPNLTYLVLQDSDDNLVSGIKRVVSGQYRWILNDPIVPGEDSSANYKIALKATDMAGNSRTYTYEFLFVSDPTPELIDWMPWGMDYTYVNTHEFNPPELEGEFKDYFGIVEDWDKTYIRMYFPSGDSVYSPHGGDLYYEPTDSSMVVRLELDGELHTDGEDDGLYTVSIRAENELGAVYHEYQYMMYDTVVPEPIEVLYRDLNGIYREVTGDSTESSTGITQIQVKYSDLTSGMYYTPNLTKVALFDPNDEIVSGFHSYGPFVDADSLVIWTLRTPLANDGSDDGQYSIHLVATDKAGNMMRQQIPLALHSPVQPLEFTWMLDAVYRVHLNWEEYTPSVTRRDLMSSRRKDVQMKGARELTYYSVKRRLNDGNWKEIAQTTTHDYVDDLLDEPDGTYRYSLAAVYTSGESEQLYSDDIPIKRFAEATITVYESDGETPIDNAYIGVFGEDGLYNMEFNLYTDEEGVVTISGIYMELYRVTIEKDGYESVEASIDVDSDPADFSFTLGQSQTIGSVEPQKTVMYQNYPNPFNPETKVKFGLKHDSSVEILIYNTRGQLVKVLYDDDLKAGFHSIKWDGKDEATKPVSSGIYFCKFRAVSSEETIQDIRKMIMLK